MPSIFRASPLPSARARSRTPRRYVCSDAWGLFFWQSRRERRSRAIKKSPGLAGANQCRSNHLQTDAHSKEEKALHRSDGLVTLYHARGKKRPRLPEGRGPKGRRKSTTALFRLRPPCGPSKRGEHSAGPAPNPLKAVSMFRARSSDGRYTSADLTGRRNTLLCKWKGMHGRGSRRS